MRVNGLEYADGIGWFDPAIALCINGCGKPAVGEGPMELVSFYMDELSADFNTTVDLLCEDCLNCLPEYSKSDA